MGTLSILANGVQLRIAYNFGLQPQDHRHRVTVVVPTLGNPFLAACVASLDRQTFSSMQVVVVDNSGSSQARALLSPDARARIIENHANVGFGGAVNQGFRQCPAEFLATLNDDAEAAPDWLESLVAALDAEPRAGMAAPLVTLADSGRVDSAGMMIARDASSRQRGHNDPPDAWNQPGEALCPSGSAAVYRSAMLEQTGLFEESFFLYCEDTDLGLRGRWAGWNCVYVPQARVSHHYSASAGRASESKAWLVERNRLRLAVRCLPLSWLLAAPLATLLRYFWHAVSLFDGRGKAAEFTRGGGGFLSLLSIVVRAHWDLISNGTRLWRERREIQSGPLSSSGMAAVLHRFRVTLREVARH